MNIKAPPKQATDNIGRRDFVRSSVASVLTAVPASRRWADAASPGAIPDTVAAVNLSGQPISLTAADIKDFRAGLAGQLLLRTNAGYAQARKIWNGAFDRHPSPVVRCFGSDGNSITQHMTVHVGDALVADVTTISHRVK